MCCCLTGFAGLCFVTTVCAQDTSNVPQNDTNKTWTGRAIQSIINYYLDDTSIAHKPKFLIYPTLALTPETSWEIGLSSLLLYYAKNDTSNRLSEISAFTFYTLNKQYGAYFDHFLYGDKDKWFFLGRLRYQRFPLQYYGIGPAAKIEDKAIINADYTLVRERVLRKVRPNFFAGLETDLQIVSRVSLEQGTGNLPPPPGIEGNRTVGLGVGLVYDNRHNPLNVRKGLFAEAAFLHYAPAWGSEYRFSSLSLDTRLYRTLRKNQVLAAQVAGQFQSGDVPFNQMALLGGESLMRGYYYGRYRDNALLAAQAEYRFLPLPFSRRLGAAVFASAGTVAPSLKAMQWQQIKPAAGAGIRFLVFPRRDIFARFDVAFTPEGFNFYFYTGEAF